MDSDKGWGLEFVWPVLNVFADKKNGSGCFAKQIHDWLVASMSSIFIDGMGILFLNVLSVHFLEAIHIFYALLVFLNNMTVLGENIDGIKSIILF